MPPSRCPTSAPKPLLARLGGALLIACATMATALGHGFGDGSFEGRQTHSIGLTPDGLRLLTLNVPDGRLTVFAVSDAANPKPVLIAEIPVGIEPVAVRARTNDEVWVVNEVSDSVSDVSLAEGTVIATLPVPDELGDVVFAQGRAFVSCSRNNLLRVFDATTRQPLGTIPLQGLYPRALAVNPAGTKVFAAFLLSGNGTTILPPAQAPAPPAPTNPNLPPAPQTALIVPASDPRIAFTVLDRDVAEVDVASGTVTRYLSGARTNLFDVAVQPGAGHVWVANSEARDLIRFEPALRGHVADHRLTRLEDARAQSERLLAHGAGSGAPRFGELVLPVLQHLAGSRSGHRSASHLQQPGKHRVGGRCELRGLRG